MKNEIIIYQAKERAQHIEVRVEDETVWLNRNQIASLFSRDIKTIGKHINNTYNEGELDKSSTVAIFATVQFEGGRQVERNIEHYNLDVIISVGYRVKSKLRNTISYLGKQNPQRLSVKRLFSESENESHRRQC